MLEPTITNIRLKQAQTECECGTLLPYRTSPFMTAERRVCPKCKRIHNVDYAPTDWGTNFKKEIKQC